MYDLLGKKMTGDASAEELRNLEVLLSKYPEFRFMHDELIKQDDDREAAAEQALQAYAVHYYGKMCQDINSDGNEDHTPDLMIAGEEKRHKWGWLKIAAVITVPLLLGIISYNYLHKADMDDSRPGINVSEMITQKGSKSKIKLPDGTTVLLNADSKISYSKNFDVNSRVVTLTGEAYFDVVHNAESPFIIHTEKADIKVLGTELNVRAYPGEAKFETSLIRGKVEVDMKNSNKAIILKPSEKIVLSKNNSTGYNLTQVTKLDAAVAETAWTNGQLSFIDESFATIATELERQYNVTIEFKNTTALSYRYTGIFDKTRLEDVLNILKLVKPFNYTIADNTVTIF